MEIETIPMATIPTHREPVAPQWAKVAAKPPSKASSSKNAISAERKFAAALNRGSGNIQYQVSNNFARLQTAVTGIGLSSSDTTAETSVSSLMVAAEQGRNPANLEVARMREELKEFREAFSFMQENMKQMMFGSAPLYTANTSLTAGSSTTLVPFQEHATDMEVHSPPSRSPPHSPARGKSYAQRVQHTPPHTHMTKASRQGSIKKTKLSSSPVSNRYADLADDSSSDPWEDSKPAAKEDILYAASVADSYSNFTSVKKAPTTEATWRAVKK
jgi:hypothetical protein